MYIHRIAAFAVLSLLPLTSVATAQPDKELKQVTNHVRGMYDIKPKLLQATALKKVINAKCYEVKIAFKHGMMTTNSTIRLCKVKDQFVTIDIYSNGEKPELLKLIKPNFKLKTAEQAQIFKEALDAMFPASQFARKDLTHYKKDNQWIFIRKKSFGKGRGFIVTTNPAGKITKIEYQFDIVEKS